MRYLSLLVFFTLSALPYYAYSYCIYNKHTDETFLDVRQVLPITMTRSFHKQVYPGGKECCPYTTYDCNPTYPTDHEPLKLWISRVNGRELTRFTLTLPSGGWVVVDGDKVQHTVAVKNADGTDYPTIIEYGANYV